MMASPPDPPRNQISYADKAADEEPQAFRPDHYDHDTKFARTQYAELAPKKEEQVTLPRWMVLFLFLMVIMFILMFASKTFSGLGF
jgi:hypothetical protein